MSGMLPRLSLQEQCSRNKSLGFAKENRVQRELTLRIVTPQGNILRAHEALDALQNGTLDQLMIRVDQLRRSSSNFDEETFARFLAVISSREINELKEIDGLFNPFNLSPHLLGESKQLASALARHAALSASIAAARKGVGPEDEDTEGSDLLARFEIKGVETRFSDVGGASTAKKEFRRIQLAMKHPETFRKRGGKMPRGILLYGPPGTGKTLLVKAFAGELDAFFYQIRIQDIVSMWHGQSERKLAQILEAADRKAEATGRHAIIFVDEIETLIPSRDGADRTHEVTKKMLGILLDWMQGLKPQSQVMVIGATNRREAIDAAMLRPGRFSYQIEIGLPTREDRKEIIEIYLGKNGGLFDTTEASDALLDATDGFSGAAIEEIFTRVINEQVNELLEAVEAAQGNPELLTEPELIPVQLLIASAEKVREELSISRTNGHGRQRIGFQPVG